LTRVAQISKNTLAFYREAPNPVPINLCEILDGVLGLYEQKIRFDDIRIVKQYDFRGEIPGFPGELRQVFSNLIRNALEAVKQGGTVTLRITQARDWREPHRKGVRVLIADDGTGVSREYRTKLFQPFFSTKGEKGSGLGLWITRGIVRKHGGKIRVHSITRQGRSGTCFSVFLPFQYAGVEAAQRSSA
jgi:signal transduction histidine kinase